ncbi:MAG: hypothetical protein ACI9H8_001752 [Lysobacterales bacterium]|jgi:hypothetical protein
MTRIVFIAFLLLMSGAVFADVLIIDEVRQIDTMDLPENGQTKTNIESKFGAPESRQQAVGDPPISRWDYGNYSVYFEYDLVLFSVLHPGNVVESS